MPSLYVLNQKETSLASPESGVALALANELVTFHGFQQVDSCQRADLVLMEQPWAFRERRFVRTLLDDPVIPMCADRLCVVNSDDYATGLLRGLYMNIGKKTIVHESHRAVPYWSTPNSQSHFEPSTQKPKYLATWRGNTISHPVRKKLVKALEGKDRFLCESTDSWLNHGDDERSRYTELMRSSLFSLCPSGWGPASFRLYESMSAGRCPVIISDDFNPIEGIDWSTFSIKVAEADVDQIDSILQSREKDAVEMGMRAREVWESACSPDTVVKTYAQLAIQLLQTCCQTTARDEVDRWRSFKTWRSNGWHLDQRLLRRLQRKLHH